MGVCTHACEWVGRVGEGVVWGVVVWRGVVEGSVRWKNSKDRRACVMCHNGDRSSASGVLEKRQRGDGETDSPTQGESEGEGGDDQKDCGP